MFRQSIDPKGGFPPKGSKKPVKRKKKKGLRKRRSKKQNFDRERKAERAFRFGEVRSGSSGRSVFNPNDFIRFHQSAQFNQQRDSAELSRSGGTFTGTSIGEQRKVLEAQQADVEFKKQQLQVQNRFAGALENFVERIPRTRGATTPAVINLQDRTTSGISIDEELQDISLPPSFPAEPQPEPEQLQPLLQDETRRRGIPDPVPEVQSYASHRKPEDDLNVVGSSSRGLPRQTSGGSVGSLSRQTSGSSVIEAVTRSRPTPSNPSKTDTIASDHFSERRSQEQVGKPDAGLVSKLEAKLIKEFRPPKEAGIQPDGSYIPPSAKPAKVQKPAPLPKVPADEDSDEDIPDLEPTSSASVLDYKDGESVSERAERLKIQFPDQPTFKVKTSDKAPKVEDEDKPESDAQKQVRLEQEAVQQKQQEAVDRARARREEKRRQIQEAGIRAGITPQPEPEPEPQPLPQVPEPEPVVASVPEVTAPAGGEVEEVDEIGEWLDTLKDSGNNPFSTSQKKNKMTRDTYSFVDTGGIIKKDGVRGKEVVILAINKNKSVLVQLKDTVGTGEEVGDGVRANISYKKFLENRKNLDLKPFALADED